MSIINCLYMRAMFFLFVLMANITNADLRPNFVFIIADDWSYPHAGFLGDKTVKTPAFDMLASSGVNFSNAYVTAPSCSPSRAAILSGQHHWRLEYAANLGGSLKADIPLFTDLLKEAGYLVGKFGKSHWPSNHSFREEPFPKKYLKIDSFLETRKKDQPFFYWYGAREPHRHYEKGIGKKHGIDSSKIQVPDCMPDRLDIREDIADYYYYVQKFDKQCAEIIEALEKADELENTVVVITSDNGMPFPRAKATLYDLGIKVPLAIKWPKNFPGKRQVTDFVSLHDLAPTFLELAGLEIPETMNGRSLVNILKSNKEGRIEEERSFVLAGMERHVECNPQRALRTDRFLLIKNYKQKWPVANSDYNYNIDPSPSKAFIMNNKNDPEIQPFYKMAFEARGEYEIYDLSQDPGQIRNLVNNPEYQQVKEELIKKLKSELEGSGDPRVLRPGELFEDFRKKDKK